MTQLFESRDRNSHKTWLEEEYIAKKKRTFRLGKEAIDSLRDSGDRVSYRNIEARSKELDPEGKGIHANSVKANEELHQYYLKFASGNRVSKAPSVASGKSISYQHLKQNRDVTELRRRYLRLTKNELVTQLIQAEQYIAERQTEWKKNLFEQFK